jgi:hypothetical protein
MAKRLKYLMWSGAAQTVKDNIPSGLFMWAEAFKRHGLQGEMNANLVKEYLENFDIVHVNWTPANASYISGVRSTLGNSSSTKIIANVDHAVGMWGAIDPFVMTKELNRANFVFHVESNGAAGLEQLLDKKIPVIPHPINTEYIKSQRKQTDYPIVITCQYHRYFETWSEYFRTTWRLRKKYPELRVVLIGVTEPPKLKIGINSTFSDVLGRLPWKTYIDFLSQAFLNISTTLDYTYGRDVVEAAALGVPTVGSRTIEAMRNIWPSLAYDPVDTTSMEWELDNLLLDPEYASEMSKQGIDKCEHYSLKNSHDRMVVELEKAEVI